VTLSLEAGLVVVLTEIEIALGIGLGVYNLLFSRTTSLSIYKLGDYLIVIES
jgi:hypothetical protein